MMDDNFQMDENLFKLESKYFTMPIPEIQKDMQHLADVAEDVRREPNAEELLEAVAKFAFECMPADAREQMREMMMIGDKPMDQAFRAASTLIKAEKLEEAETILKAISDKIEKYYEECVKFSL